MQASQSVVELVAAAQATAKTSEDRISELLKQMDGSDARLAELREATRALELVAVDIFTLFESRMQGHFKRGPFSRKLKSMLIASGETDLADRFHQYYLAINVLKHGKGASYRELLATPSALYDVKHPDEVATDDADTAPSLIDISKPGFFDGLARTLRDAYHFLETA
ncbi:hypothetical protein [Celeribacter sp.]|uniref:hypothetical protein n=1 Tax=Celeribacter sp. TaxID=1890673 RepID=UPI003A931943